MTDFTRRTTMKAIAASAVLAPLPVTASTDGEVAALAEKYHRLEDEAQALEDRAEERFFSIPDNISDISQTIRHGANTYRAYNVEEIAAAYDAKIGTPWAHEVIEWAQATTGKKVLAPSGYVKPYKDWLRGECARALDEYRTAHARREQAEAEAGVTEAEAEAERIREDEKATLNAIINTPSGGPRDMLAKLNLMLTPENEPVAYVWAGDMQESLRRDLEAMSHG